MIERDAILQRVVALETLKGHLKWKVSDLARLSKVSRPLIYYHFGKTKAEILTRCLELIAEDYFGFSGERKKLLAEGRVAESLLQTRKLYLQNPALAEFYQKWRMQHSPLQKKLVQIEKRYQKKIRESLPHLNETQVIALHGVFHGLVTAPFMTDEALKETLRALQPWLGIVNRT